MTTYKDALREARTVGAGHANDAAEMALFCAGPLQLLVGASPRGSCGKARRSAG